MGRRASVKVFCEKGVRLLGDNIGGIGYGDRATLRDDICGSVGSLCLCKARALQTWSRDLELEKIKWRTFHQRSTSATSARNAVLSLDMILVRLGCLLESNKNDSEGYLRPTTSRGIGSPISESGTDACDIYFPCSRVFRFRDQSLRRAE